LEKREEALPEEQPEALQVRLLAFLGEQVANERLCVSSGGCLIGVLEHLEERGGEVDLLPKMSQRLVCCAMWLFFEQALQSMHDVMRVPEGHG
jgi:hypothetical protein